MELVSQSALLESPGRNSMPGNHRKPKGDICDMDHMATWTSLRRAAPFLASLAGLQFRGAVRCSAVQCSNSGRLVQPGMLDVGHERGN